MSVKAMKCSLSAMRWFSKLTPKRKLCYHNKETQCSCVDINLYCLFVCLFDCLWLHKQFFSYLVAVALIKDRVANLDLFFAVTAFSSEGLFTCHTYCDTKSQFIWSHLKDRSPHLTMGPLK
jgi:hypothetical protein